MIKNFSLLIFMSIIMVGCSTKVHYAEKYIPIKCVGSIPEKPKYNEDVWIYLENTLKYKDLLEKIVEECSETPLY